MKKFKILILCLFAILVSGCSEIKSSIDGETFKEKAEGYKYVIQDITSQYAYAESSYLISNDNFKILYVEGKKKYDIEGIFIDECKNIFNTIGDVVYKDNVSGGTNWTSLSVTTDDTYYYVSWIDDTYIYASSSIDGKKNIEKFMDELGY